MRAYAAAAGTALPESVWARVHGVELLLPAQDRVLTPFVLINRTWDPAVLAALRRCMAVSTGFLDVGAMIGFFSAVIAKEFPLSPVIAIEPSPRNLLLAAQNLGHFPNVTLLEGAVEEDTDRRWFVAENTKNTGDSRVIPDHGDGLEIPALTLRELLGRHPAEVVKIDVQGSEREVLRSLSVETLAQKNLAIVCEITPAAWASHQEILDEFARFTAAGFAVFVVTESPDDTPFTAAFLEAFMSIASPWNDHVDVLIVRGRATPRGAEHRAAK